MMHGNTARRMLVCLATVTLMGAAVAWAPPVQAMDGPVPNPSVQTASPTPPDPPAAQPQGWSFTSVLLLVIKVLAGVFATIVLLVVMLPIIAAVRVMVSKLLGRDSSGTGT